MSKKKVNDTCRPPSLKWHAMESGAVLSRLHSDPKNGLSEQGVEKSAACGTNKLSYKKSKPIFIRVIEALTEPMMLILLSALVITVVVNIVTMVRGGRFDFTEVVGILAAIAVSVTISLIMEGRSAKAFEALKKETKGMTVKVVRGGLSMGLTPDKLVAGDVVLLSVGDKAAADMRLIESEGLEVDESPLTGESVPVKKKLHPVEENTPLAERNCMVYGGCFITAGFARAVVTEVGDRTEIGKIAGEIAVEAETTPIQQKLSKLGKIIAILGALMAGIVFSVQLIRLILDNSAVLNFASVSDIFVTSIVLIVASVPEGLPTVVAVSLALNVIKMAKNNALVKKMVACETIGCVSVICSDKTGTLTENKMTVCELVVVGDRQRILNNFALNSTADLELSASPVGFLGSPTECALLMQYEKERGSYKKAREQADYAAKFAFSSNLKRMSVVVREDVGNIAYLKGAPETVLAMCEISHFEMKKYLAELEKYEKKAKRVLALAHGKAGNSLKREDVEKGLTLDGFAVISDPVRKDVYAAVREALGAGIEVKMLTGDNELTARAIAEELDILGSGEVVHASELDAMGDEELSRRIKNIKVVARSTPNTKLRVVRMLKKMGAVVAVTGDGINDAPAIKNADVGIAMGKTGTEVSKEASDIVVLDDSFTTIVKAVRWGRGIYENFQRFIMFQLTVNLAAVLTVVLAIMFDFEPPFNALELLWINLIMDGPPALTLGLEAMHDDLMKRKPVGRNAPIVTRKMLFRIVAGGAYMGAVMFAQAMFNFLGISGGAGKEKTALFTLFVIFQLFNAFNARELGLGSIFSTLKKNKLMLIVMGITFAIQILITQFGGAVFNTVPLNFGEWIRVILMGFSIIAFTEIYKLLLRPMKKLVEPIFHSKKSTELGH